MRVHIIIVCGLLATSLPALAQESSSNHPAPEASTAYSCKFIAGLDENDSTFYFGGVQAGMMVGSNFTLFLDVTTGIKKTADIDTSLLGYVIGTMTVGELRHHVLAECASNPVLGIREAIMAVLKRRAFHYQERVNEEEK